MHWTELHLRGPRVRNRQAATCLMQPVTIYTGPLIVRVS